MFYKLFRNKLILCLVVYMVFTVALFAKEKMIVGATEKIFIPEINLNFLARIDTGAKTTSINAQNIKVVNPSENKENDIGKKIEFDTINEKNEVKHIVTKITGIKQVRNAQGVEVRYMVPLTLRWKNFEKKIKVNLRDRTKMTYKLLIGRDWLIDNFLVDVSIIKGD